jgi:hypothetical protein
VDACSEELMCAILALSDVPAPSSAPLSLIPMVCNFPILSINTMKIPVFSQPALRANGSFRSSAAPCHCAGQVKSANTHLQCRICCLFRAQNLSWHERLRGPPFQATTRISKGASARLALISLILHLVLAFPARDATICD